MNPRQIRSRVPTQLARNVIAIICAVLILPGNTGLWAMQPQQPASSASQGQQAAPSANQDTKIPNDQLDSLVAPIALYPDPLLSHALVASTYPLEIVKAQQWLQQNSTLRGAQLADAA